LPWLRAEPRRRLGDALLACRELVEIVVIGDAVEGGSPLIYIDSASDALCRRRRGYHGRKLRRVDSRHLHAIQAAVCQPGQRYAGRREPRTHERPAVPVHVWRGNLARQNSIRLFHGLALVFLPTFGASVAATHLVLVSQISYSRST